MWVKLAALISAINAAVLLSKMYQAHTQGGQAEGPPDDGFIWEPEGFGVDGSCIKVWRNVELAPLGLQDVPPWIRHWVGNVSGVLKSSSANQYLAGQFLPHLQRAVTVYRFVKQWRDWSRREGISPSWPAHNCYMELLTGHLEYACECAAVMCEHKENSELSVTLVDGHNVDMRPEWCGSGDVEEL